MIAKRVNADSPGSFLVNYLTNDLEPLALQYQRVSVSQFLGPSSDTARYRGPGWQGP